ncbi:MAG: glycoside hydrolase [Acidobacteriota bacterium]|nr:glycoside hydrolase [Acidobacteriota bacterium]
MKSILAALPTVVLLLGAGLLNGDRATVVSGGGYFPVLIRLHDGKLMAVLRGGAPHIGVKGRLDVVTSTDEGKTWSPPRTVIDGPDDDRNPAFGELKNGDLLLAYAIIHAYDESGLKLLAKSRNERKVDGVYVTRSTDGGKTWSQPALSEKTHALQKNGATISPYGKLVQLSDGTVLMSVYYEFFDGRGNQDFVFRSHDGGKTWGEPSLVGEHSNETGLVALANGDLLAALRSEQGAHLSITSSKDQGHTWSTPVQITRDNEHPADLIRLKNGDILLTYGERNQPFGVEAILSHDAGKTWDEKSKVILANDASNRDCGYPSSVQLPSGKIVTMYYQVDNAKDTPASAKAKSIVWVPQS